MVEPKRRIIIISIFFNAIFLFSTVDAQQGVNPGQPSFLSDMRDISLEWKPSREVRSTPDMDLSLLQRNKLAIKPFHDLRNNQSEIGRNVERKFTEKDLLVTTKDNASEWLTRNFTEVLTDLNVSMSKEQGDAFLAADILKFYVKESGRYSATILLKIRLLSREGTILWEDIIAGTSNNWGVFFKKDNYVEGLSDACIDAANNLVRNEGFKTALKQIK